MRPPPSFTFTMPLNKFGQYLGSESTIRDDLKVERDLVNFENRRVAGIHKSFLKTDAICRAELDEQVVFLNTKLKANIKDIKDLRVKVEQLSARITTQTHAPQPAQTPSATAIAPGKRLKKNE